MTHDRAAKELSERMSNQKVEGNDGPGFRHVNCPKMLWEELEAFVGSAAKEGEGLADKLERQFRPGLQPGTKFTEGYETCLNDLRVLERATQPPQEILLRALGEWVYQYPDRHLSREHAKALELVSIYAAEERNPDERTKDTSKFPSGGG